MVIGSRKVSVLRVFLSFIKCTGVGFGGSI